MTDLTVRDYHDFNCKVITQIQDHPVTIWIPPEAPLLKLNVDISFKSPSVICGIGFILRDSTGTFIMAGTGSTCAGSAQTAKYSGVLAAIQWCLEHGFGQSK
ncbi:hypothetical protein FRX31_009486 [Thalictrum thalictroides]|uniref:RNase H type-1 domain-containing protein n=1 Tax=Thalictrum thalictroides TaxID=46969 RepID=A0A7J6WW79_THATH|nr:hypothetical protein FRX31_009486 [Thalictrum thalictroides]